MIFYMSIPYMYWVVGVTQDGQTFQASFCSCTWACLDMGYTSQTGQLPYGKSSDKPIGILPWQKFGSIIECRWFFFLQPQHHSVLQPRHVFMYTFDIGSNRPPKHLCTSFPMPQVRWKLTFIWWDIAVWKVCWVSQETWTYRGDPVGVCVCFCEFPR